MKGARRKRSSSPVSRDAAPSDDPTSSPEDSKPAAKRAKRGGRVGAAKVVKRPARQGTCLLALR